MTASTPQIEIHRAADRFGTKIDWLDAKHCFSFNRHYDPANTHHGLLIVSNEDTIQPDTGFQTHPHEDMEIVTWVLDGQLEHTDSEGNNGIIYPGLAQRMSAGRGIWHSEINATDRAPVHLVQMWVLPDTPRIAPGYEQLDIAHELAKGGLIPLASGRNPGRENHAAISIRQKDAVLWVGKLRPGERVTIPEAPFVHLFVAGGGVDLAAGGGPTLTAPLRLDHGDALRLTHAGGIAATADPASGAELLVWEMASGLNG